MSDAADPTPPPEEPSVEIHKPKPVHSWRELLTEIGVVVIGVCIALGAEQTVEWFHWRAQVRDAREVIATELTTNLVGAINRLRTAPCTGRRLDQLAQIVDAAAKTGSLPPLGNTNLPPRTAWPSGAWDSVVASQTATHFPRQQLADIAGAYKFVQRFDEYSAREVESWNQLMTMTGPGRRLDPASEADLRKSLSSARTYNAVFVRVSAQLADLVRNLHLPFSQTDLAALAAAGGRPLPSFPICQSIGPATSFYGQGDTTATTLSNGVRITTDDAEKAVPVFSEGTR